MHAPYKRKDVGSTPTGTTTMKHKYLHKLVEIKLDGKFQTGFVIDEFESFYGDNKIRVLLQRTGEKVFFNTIFGKPTLLEE